MPSIVTTSTSGQSGASTSITINLPSSLSPGNVVVVMLGLGAEATITSGIGDWAVIDDYQAHSNSTYILARIVDESWSGDSTLGVGISSSARMGAVCWQVADHGGPDRIAGLIREANSADPPEVTAPWGAAANLFLAGRNRDPSTLQPNQAPTNYSGLLVGVAGTSSSSGRIWQAGAHRNLTAASDDPGEFLVSGSPIALGNGSHAMSVVIGPPAVSFGVIGVSEYKHGAASVVATAGLDFNAAYSLYASPVDDHEDADAVELTVVDDDEGEGTVTVTANRSIVRYGDEIYIILVQGSDVGSFQTTTLLPDGHLMMVGDGVDPNPAPGERLVTSPDLEDGDAVIWFGVKDESDDPLPTHYVEFFPDFSFAWHEDVAQFTAEVHKDGEGYSAAAVITLQAPGTDFTGVASAVAAIAQPGVLVADEAVPQQFTGVAAIAGAVSAAGALDAGQTVVLVGAASQSGAISGIGTLAAYRAVLLDGTQSVSGALASPGAFEAGTVVSVELSGIAASVSVPATPGLLTVDESVPFASAGVAAQSAVSSASGVLIAGASVPAILTGVAAVAAAPAEQGQVAVGIETDGAESRSGVSAIPGDLAVDETVNVRLFGVTSRAGVESASGEAVAGVVLDGEAALAALAVQPGTFQAGASIPAVFAGEGALCGTVADDGQAKAGIAPQGAIARCGTSAEGGSQVLGWVGTGQAAESLTRAEAGSIFLGVLLARPIINTGTVDISPRYSAEVEQ